MQTRNTKNIILWKRVIEREMKQLEIEQFYSVYPGAPSHDDEIIDFLG